MKKLILMFGIFLLVRQADAQYYLTPVKLDDKVSVSMPKEFRKTNANGQGILLANGQYGSMMVITSANPTAAKTVKNPNGLDNVFKDYVKNVQKSLPAGTIINDHDTTIGKLVARDFILQVDTGSGTQSRHFIMLYTKSTSYTFEYLYDDFRKNYAMGEMKAFLGSINVSPELTYADQYMIVARSLPVVRIIIIAGIAFVIIGLVVFYRRRPKLVA